MDKSNLDAISVYCPDTRKCYYLHPRRFERGVALRVEATRNNQREGVVWADDFTRFPPAP